jgi:hypothetical protein
VEIIRALEDRYGDWCMAIRRQEQPKKWTQGDGGSWQKCVTIYGQVTCRTIPALCKGHGHQGPDGDSVARGAPEVSGRDVGCSGNATAASEAKQEAGAISRKQEGDFMRP